MNLLLAHTLFRRKARLARIPSSSEAGRGRVVKGICWWGSGGEEHAVDDVDDTVAGVDIDGGHCEYREAVIGRTARRLMEGYVLVPESQFG